MNFRELVISALPNPSALLVFSVYVLYIATCNHWLHLFGQQDFHPGFKAMISETTGVSLITSSRKFIEYYIKGRLTSKYTFNFYIWIEISKHLIKNLEKNYCYVCISRMLILNISIPIPMMT